MHLQCSAWGYICQQSHHFDLRLPKDAYSVVHAIMNHGLPRGFIMNFQFFLEKNQELAIRLSFIDFKIFIQVSYQDLT
ncbi:Uncharacterised protein [Yersinia ruckeri]|uniref:Uncharacterized protein n=1 Tax=Yersinia ruckeri TaxID=29486 RepID=A0A380SAX8_YERRU|nr:Uncharacterised protein [Yersinia ruckeri]